MTTDEAISVLTALKTEHNSELTDEAVDLAIEALIKQKQDEEGVRK